MEVVVALLLSHTYFLSHHAAVSLFVITLEITHRILAFVGLYSALFIMYYSLHFLHHKQRNAQFLGMVRRDTH